MAQTLTDPVARPSLIQQGVTKLNFDLPHQANPQGGVRLDRAQIKVTYEVTSWDADRNVLYRSYRTVQLLDWPVAFTNDVKAVYAKIEQDAVANGLIGSGTPEELS